MSSERASVDPPAPEPAATPGGGPLAELSAVSKSFGRTRALDAVSIRIEPGVSYGLVGRNGAGKTTAIRLLAGLLRPDAGWARLLGGDPIRDAERVKVRLGYLAEDQVFPPSLRASDLIGFFRSCYPTWDDGLAARLVARYELPLERRLRTLSRGQQRQVGLVCAMAHRPRILLLDEPGGGLDPVVRRQFLEDVVELLAGEGTSVVFSSHNLAEVERIATRVGILHRGALLLEEDLDRLRERSSRAIVAADGLDPASVSVRLPSCVRARPRGDSWILTFLAPPAEAAAAVRAGLGVEGAETAPLTLEDLFFELVGGDACSP